MKKCVFRSGGRNSKGPDTKIGVTGVKGGNNKNKNTAPNRVCVVVVMGKQAVEKKTGRLGEKIADIWVGESI